MKWPTSLSVRKGRMSSLPASFKSSPPRTGPLAATSLGLPATGLITPANCYRLIPKDLKANASYRQWLLEECHKNRELQQVVRSLCSQNILFWINTFLWGLDPRQTNSGSMTPFVTFQCQDEGLLELQDCLYPQPGMQQSDATCEKSRDIGVTFLCTFLFLHSWQFNMDRHDLFFLSWKEELVDGGDKSIFGKVDLALECQPSWLLPPGFRMREHRTKKNLINPVTQATLTGEGTSAKAGTGGRFRGMFFDEFPLVEPRDSERIWIKSRDCSRCRIVNGTHEGKHTTFYKLTQQSGIRHIKIGWWEHPWKNQGLERRGTKWWSPWYEQECEIRGYNRRAIAQELDIDPTGAGVLFFEPDEINRLIDNYSCDPWHEGTMHDGKFVEVPGGKLELWFDLLPSGLPPAGRYGLGVDVATGSQGESSTPSCISVVNLDTGEKVAAYKDRTLDEQELANMAHALAVWFHGAAVNWEQAGPGASFKKQLVDVRRWNRLYRNPERKKIFGKLSDQVGYALTKESKRFMLTAYRAALSSGRFLNRSKSALRETLEFIYDGEDIVHSSQLTKNDPLQVGVNHGDEVIADALANLFMDDRLREGEEGEVRKVREMTPDGFDPANPPYGSMAWRDMQAEKQEYEEALDGW